MMDLKKHSLITRGDTKMGSVVAQAVILAGGIGLRMRPLTLTTPKPMIKIQGKPFLFYLIKLLKQNGITDILLLVGYLHEQIEDYFKDGRSFGVNITYSYSQVEDETGTRIRKAKHLLHDTFLLLYGDNYWPLRLSELTELFSKKNTLGLVTAYSNLDNYSKNNIYVNDDGLVGVYDKEKKIKNLNGVDIGFFILNKKVVDLLPEENCSFEAKVLPKLITHKQLAGFLTNHKYYSLSNLERIPVVEEFFREKKIVFLDRDGTINKKPQKAQYITLWEKFYFLPKALEALHLLKERGYTVFIITNQPGIARKMLSEDQFKNIHKKMIHEIKKNGGEVTDIFVCKHGWDDGCFCRKPNPGLFFQAASKYNINLYDSYCIGDDERDIIAGSRAGCKTFLITPKKSLYDIVKKYL